MRVFQYVALTMLALFIVTSIVNLVRRRSRFLVGVFWLTVWCLAFAAMLVPDATTKVALKLGILRGADLVSYCAILAGMVGFFIVHVRLRQVNRQLTLLTRELALRSAQAPKSRPAGDEPAPSQPAEPA